MAKRKRPPTWAEVGFHNAGIRTTTRALKFALGWGLASATLNREPASIDEYAEVMQESRATAFRDQQAFRDAYPDETNPTRMNVSTGAQERYDELWRTLSDRKRFVVQAQPMVFFVGGHAAS